MTKEHSSTHSPLLGTDVTVVVSASSAADAQHIDTTVVHEIERLEALLSRFQPNSALERWKRDELTTIDPHFVEVMRRSAHWTSTTRGALDPRAPLFTKLWTKAAELDREPTEAELNDVLRTLSEPAFSVDDAGAPQRLGDCSAIELHAFAKGWIIDRALERGFAGTHPFPSNAAVLINAGGDIARCGPGTSTISIDDPLRPYDNAPPLDRIRLERGGLATSGHTRRSSTIGGRSIPHLIDPRSGRPAAGALSVSVIGRTAEEADAWATALSITAPDELLDAADHADVGALAVLNDGEVITNERWEEQRVR